MSGHSLPVNYESVSREWIRALRGKRSQRGFSQLLGYRTNVTHDWESGRSFPKASVGFEIVATVGGHVPSHVARLLPGSTSLPDPRTPDGLAHLMVGLCQGEPVADLADRLGVSRFRLGRWLRGDSEPKLPDFLHLVDVTTGRLCDFVSAYADPAEIPTLQQRWTQERQLQRLARQAPLAEAIVAAFAIAQDSPTSDWFAAKLGATHQDAAETLALLEANDVVRHLGTGGWALLQTPERPGSEPPGTNNTKRFWARFAANRLGQVDTASGDYTLVPVNANQLEKLRALQREIVRTVRSVSRETSEQAQEVALFACQVMTLSGKEP